MTARAAVAVLSWLLVVAHGYGFLQLPQVAVVAIAAVSRPDAAR